MRRATTGFTLLGPGTYTHLGFGVRLSINAAAGHGYRSVKPQPPNIQLALGTASGSVRVSAGQKRYRSENAEISTTITQQQISQTPNPGNDLDYIVQTAPGAVMNTQAGYGNSSTFGPATSNIFTVDGMNENDPFLNLNNSGATNLLLGKNDIREATVVNNGYSGQYGGLAGANVSQRHALRQQQLAWQCRIFLEWPRLERE